jgi:hypothetical protein
MRYAISHSPRSLIPRGVSLPLMEKLSFCTAVQNRTVFSVGLLKAKA